MSDLIYVQHPQPSASEILKVLNDFKTEEERYLTNTGQSVNFRLEFLNNIFDKIKSECRL